MKIGVIALDFAKREEQFEPNPVNQALAAVTDDIVLQLLNQRYEPVVIAQWAIARALAYEPAYVVTDEDASPKPGSAVYLDSEDVIRIAAEHFKCRDIRYVIIVANPWLHLPACQALARRYGLKVIRDYHIGHVGFDNTPHNLQWWCKGPIRLLAYTALQVIGKLIGKDFHGIGERQPQSH